MKEVGQQLEVWAIDQSEIRMVDLFGRSAFNRYYYAAFLVTRDMLGELHSNWKGTQHNNIPELLEGALKKPVLTQLNKNVRKEIITQGDRSRLQQELNKATTGLANLLKEAYHIRVIADYEPEIPVEITKNKVISLSGVKLSTANRWAGQAQSHCKTIRRIWQEVGLA